MPDKIPDLSRLCVHTQTTRPWSLRQCAEYYPAAGIRGISVWRHLLEGSSPGEAGRLLASSGLEVVSLVRGGFFASVRPLARKSALEENLRAIDEAAAIGAPVLVLVCGADPGQSQQVSRGQIRDGIEAILPRAEQAGIRLAIEALHPVYAADRSAITTLKQANDMALSIDSEYLGIAVDAYHTWWDPDLQGEISRCGNRGRLFAFHISDWKPVMEDVLNDRGLMGEGCIDLRQIRGWMEEAGFTGFHEVEIFSQKYWAIDQGEYLKMIRKAYLDKA
jgi:sugar phosphate isomerase/epimerase